MCLFPIFSRGCALSASENSTLAYDWNEVQQKQHTPTEPEVVKGELIFGIAKDLYEVASAGIGDHHGERRGKIALPNPNCGLTGVQCRIEGGVGDGAETRFIVDLERWRGRERGKRHRGSLG
jgi:hypothetical protein